jgi:hypothetical protein
LEQLLQRKKNEQKKKEKTTTTMSSIKTNNIWKNCLIQEKRKSDINSLLIKIKISNFNYQSSIINLQSSISNFNLQIQSSISNFNLQIQSTSTSTSERQVAQLTTKLALENPPQKSNVTVAGSLDLRTIGTVDHFFHPFEDPRPSSQF